MTLLLLFRTSDLPPPPSDLGGGGGRPDKGFLKRTEFQYWPITGKLLMEDNITLISQLIRQESYGLNGLLKQEQIVEMIGRLEIEQQMELNAKLMRIQEFIIKEKNPSKIRLLFDILDSL